MKKDFCSTTETPIFKVCLSTMEGLVSSNAGGPLRVQYKPNIWLTSPPVKAYLVFHDLVLAERYVIGLDPQLVGSDILELWAGWARKGQVLADYMALDPNDPLFCARVWLNQTTVRDTPRIGHWPLGTYAYEELYLEKLKDSYISQGERIVKVE